jgi:peptide/nickel transport system substrate-binding protein
MSCALFRAVPGWERLHPLRPGFGRIAGIAARNIVAVVLPKAAGADDTPKRGGTLEFASTVEAGNYDCHGNTSFAFLHRVAPHYSTLLKFDAANYPQIVGDLAQSWTVSPDRQTYTFKLRPTCCFTTDRR